MSSGSQSTVFSDEEEIPEYYSIDPESDEFQALPQFKQRNIVEYRERTARRERGDRDDGKFEESMHGDGKGIQMTIAFTPVAKPPPPGVRVRANVKPKSINKIAYFHEDVAFKPWIKQVLATIERPTLVHGSWIVQDRQPNDEDCWTLSYTVPYKVTSEVQIVTKNDFEEMVAQSQSIVPEGEASQAGQSAQNGDGSANGDGDLGHGGKGSKRKSTELNDEERAQNDCIKSLQQRWHCNDKSCVKTPCYVPPSQAPAEPGQQPELHGLGHIHLTHFLLSYWASAIQAGEEGVNIDNPPKEKMFDPSLEANTVDVGVLPLQQPHQAPPAVSLQTDLPPMALNQFCVSYGLLETLRLKLVKADITGPHVLYLVKDTDLRTDAQLSFGEVASLRDAENRWKADNAARWA